MSTAMDVRSFKTGKGALSGLRYGAKAALFRGDCEKLLADIPDNSIDMVVTSPPYCIGMEYEDTSTVEDFMISHRRILPQIVRITKPGGSICWQVGYHVSNRSYYPLDYAVFSILDGIENVTLRNRIIWTFSHGLHSRNRFSGRHETVLWYTKGSKYDFNLDAVRTPQKYPGKRHYKGRFKGEFSGNPLGKNPGDVWEIPNVKGNHIEKVGHPCQFPVALVQRLVRALCPSGGIVFDPYMGAGSAGVAALVENRQFLGSEINEKYVKLSMQRLMSASKGEEKIRPLGKPIFEPDPKSEVARTPAHFFRIAAE